MSKEIFFMFDEEGSEVGSFFGNNVPSTASFTKTYDYVSCRLQHSSSLKTMNDEEQVKILKNQNEGLKKQIALLKMKIKQNSGSEQCPPQTLEKQNKRLKVSIERAYYSLRTIEHKNQEMKDQFRILQESYERAIQKIEKLQKNKNQFVTSVDLLKSNHRIEISLVWERIRDLQKNLESMMTFIQEDKREENKWKEQLRNGSPKRGNLVSRLKTYK